MKKKAKHRQQQRVAAAPQPVLDAGMVLRRVESALMEGDVDSACQLLSQARPSATDSLDGELCSRAYELQAYHRWDKPARAMASLERAIEWAPKNMELRRLRAALLRRSGSHRRAASELEDAQPLASEDARVAYEAFLTKLAAGERGDDLVALARRLAPPARNRASALLSALHGDLRPAEREVSGSKLPLDRLIQGVLLVARGEAVAGLPILKCVAAQQELPRAVQAYASFYQGIAHLQLRQLAPAAEALERARGLGIPDPQVQAPLAWVYQQLAIEAVLSGGLSMAAKWFELLAGLTGPEAAEARENTGYALSLLGQERARAGDYDGAASAWSRALAITPSDTVLRQNLAIALERAGRSDEAIPHWHELARQMPRTVAGQARSGGGEQAGADEEALRRNVRAVAHRHLSDLYLEENNVERAIDQLEKAVRAAPDDVETRRSLASLLMDEGQARKAVTHFERVVEAVPESAEDRLELGLALRAAGNDQRGIEEMARALESQPDNPSVQSSLGLALAQRATGAPAAATALEDARRSTELLPPEYVGLGQIALGSAQLARGDRKGAQKSFKQAIKGAPVKAVAAKEVGRVYWRAGEREAAVAAWNDAMKRAKRAPRAYGSLAEAWAEAGNVGRCRECLEALMKRAELLPRALDAVEQISRSRKLQPLLREVLRGMVGSAHRVGDQVLLARMMVYAADKPGASSLVSQAALKAVEADDDFALSVILELDNRYRLLDRKSSLAVADWLDEHGYGDEKGGYTIPL